jgi:hypothetical protein
MLSINSTYKKTKRKGTCFIIYCSKKSFKKDRWKHCRTFHDYHEIAQYFRQVEQQGLSEKFKFLISKRSESTVIETVDLKELMLQRIKHGF